MSYLVFAQGISSSELINNAKQYDNKIVIYAGEAIGDVMVRGENAWLNLNDGENAIGIWLNKDLAASIVYTGTYKTKGDWIEISGIFHRACLEHGGDLDIHAQTLKKVNNGRVLSLGINESKKKFSLILLGVLCLILILIQLKTKSNK